MKAMRLPGINFLALAVFIIFILYLGSVNLPSQSYVAFSDGILPPISLSWKEDFAPKWMQNGPSSPSSKPTKIATIIENRPLPNLVPIILHFAVMLGPDWPIRIFHSSENAALLYKSSALARLVSNGHVKLIESTLSLGSHDKVSELLTRPWFWNQLAPATHVLLFQADSILCSNSPHKVEDYLEYDFIGAPIDPQYGHGYNGGLSLRNRTKMLEIIDSFDWNETRKFEDQWFYEKLQVMPSNLPPPDVACTFSVETMWYPTPLGVHQIERWQGANLAELQEWCPEYKLAGKGTLYSERALIA